MLFQPTSITPDKLGGMGNGIVDLSEPFVVTWMVNGNSPMTGFALTFYDADAQTVILNTGEITDGCPFYGTDSLGNKQFFSYTDDGTIATALANETECLMRITQYWGANDSTVQQTSPSAFTIKSAPTLSLTVPSPLARRDYTFTANYSQADGDALNWVRWIVAVDSEEGHANPLYDSGNIYGTALLECYYDGFISGMDYCVQCTVQTQSGVTKSTGWVSFLCSYTMGTLGGTVDATVEDCEKSALMIHWYGYNYIPGVANGSYTLSGGNLTLPAGSTVTWNQVNGRSMALPAPWTFIYKGDLQKANATVFDVTSGTHHDILTYTHKTRTLTFKCGPLTKATYTKLAGNERIVVVVGPDKLYISLYMASGALYPQTTLYPGTALYPEGRTTKQWVTDVYDLSHEQLPVTSIVLGGKQKCMFAQVINGEATEEYRESLLVYADQGDSTQAGTWFFASFDNDLNAGTLGVEGTGIEGWAVYRKKEGDEFAMHLVDLSIPETSFYDYGVGSQNGPYTYYVYPIGTDKYITDPIISEPSTIRFWDWTILECSYSDSKACYEVLNEYRFGKNLSSGEISNSNNPSVMDNLTRYPTVQLSTQRYKSGSLQSYIGRICMGTYSDTIDEREAIDALSNTTNTLFLKDRKGDIWQIRVSGEITYATLDNTAEQAVSVRIPWAEIADASSAKIIQIPEDTSGGHVDESGLILDDWGAVISNIRKGIAIYQVGDFKLLDLGTEGTVKMEIVGLNVDELMNHTGYASTTWVSKELLQNGHMMNPPISGSAGSWTEGTGSIGGWEKSEMRTYLEETIKPLLPEEVRDAIKKVIKYSMTTNAAGTQVNNAETTDDLWIPSAREVFNQKETAGPHYAAIYTETESRIKGKPGSMIGSNWWLRSSGDAVNAFTGVSPTGAKTDYASQYVYGIALGFCI